MTNFTLFASLQIMCGSFAVFFIIRDSSKRQRINGGSFLI